MDMIKKIATMLLAAIMAICCTVAFTACGSGGNETGDEIGGGVIGGDTHEHTFSDQWSNDETYHWHAATCEHTDEVSDKAEHTIENGACTVCSYKQLMESLEYTLSDDGTAYSVSGIGSITETDISIPSEYNGRPVTSIDDTAFYNRRSLTSVTIPNSVTSIGKSAFYGCTSLNSVRITDIAAWCRIDFKGASSNPLYYAHNLYLNNELVSDLTIPSSVTRIDQYAFYYCESITSVTIPSSVTWIDQSAFFGCNALNSVFITDIVAWCRIDFKDASSNPLYYAHNLYLNNELVTNLIIPSLIIGRLTSIRRYAFYGCTSLTSVTIPSGVTSIGQYAFSDCTSLTNITIPSSVTRIDSYTFSGCTSLTSINIPSSVTRISGATFIGCTSLTSVAIPDSVTGIGEHAFYGCTSLSSITIPSSVTGIGKEAFRKCRLTSVTIPSGVKIINNGVFRDCNSLQSVTVEGDVTNIGDYAFARCSSLKSITIPSSVMGIGMHAFLYCTSLNSVRITDIAAWCCIGFGDSSYSNPLYYAKNLYFNNELVTDLTIPNSVTQIDSYTFRSCTSLTSIVIPSSVTSIGTHAFSGCSSLTSVYYGGTAEQWTAISIYDGNFSLTTTRYYYSETNPFEGAGAVTEGNYWHYVDGVPTVWAK